MASSAVDGAEGENKKEAGRVKASEEGVELACYDESKKDGGCLEAREVKCTDHGR